MMQEKRDDSRMTLLHTIAREFNRSLDLDLTLRRVLIATVRVVGAQHGSFFVFDERDRLIKTLFVDGSNVVDVRREIVAHLLEKGLAGWVRRNKEGVLLSNVHDDERWYQDDNNPDLLPHESAICVPLLTEELLLGILTITHKNAGYFDNSDLTMLLAIADQAATAVKNARLYHAEQRRREVFHSLTRISRRLSATLNQETLFQLILEQLDIIIAHDQSGIFLWHGSHLTLQEGRNIPGLGSLKNLDIKLYPGDFGEQVIQEHRPVLASDLQLENSWFKDVTSRNARSWMAAPLVSDQKLLGLIMVASHLPDYYGVEDLNILVTVASQASVAITNASLLSQLDDADEQYVRMFEDNPDLILIIDLNGYILDVNRKTCQTFRRPKDAIIGSRLYLLSPNLQTVLDQQRDGLVRHRAITSEVTIKDAYKREIPIEITAQPIKFEGRQAVQWVGRDITARYELAKTRRDFTNMIVHDLRGPMGTLIGAIQMLEFLIDTSPSEDENLNEALEIIQIANRSSRYITDLIDSMLDVSKFEGGELPLNLAETSIHRLLGDVEEQTRPQADGKRIALQMDIPEDDPPIEIDHHLIRRVIINLVDNAIKYTPSGGEVSVKAYKNEDGFQVSVQDNGPGIPPQNKQSIFEKFSRLSQTASIQGIGLGLAFCKIAIEAHQGRIWVESEPGEGSTFSISLPQTLAL